MHVYTIEATTPFILEQVALLPSSRLTHALTLLTHSHFHPLQPTCGCPSEFPTLQGAQCCSGSTCVARINSDAHPVQLISDNNQNTYWQSATNQLRVNVTVALQALYEVQRITLYFKPLQPYAFVVLRSQDGSNFVPSQVCVCVGGWV